MDTHKEHKNTLSWGGKKHKNKKKSSQKEIITFAATGWAVENITICKTDKNVVIPVISLIIGDAKIIQNESSIHNRKQNSENKF